MKLVQFSNWRTKLLILAALCSVFPYIKWICPLAGGSYLHAVGWGILGSPLGSPRLVLKGILVGFGVEVVLVLLYANTDIFYISPVSAVSRAQPFSLAPYWSGHMFSGRTVIDPVFAYVIFGLLAWVSHAAILCFSLRTFLILPSRKYVSLSTITYFLVMTISLAPYVYDSTNALFEKMASCGLVLILPVAIGVLAGGFRPTTAHVCRACGYSLVGLTEPRCPECGRPFPAKLISNEAANPQKQD